MDDIDELSLSPSSPLYFRQEKSPFVWIVGFIFMFLLKLTDEQNSRNEQDEKDLTNDYFPDI